MDYSHHPITSSQFPFCPFKVLSSSSNSLMMAMRFWATLLQIYPPPYSIWDIVVVSNSSCGRLQHQVLSHLACALLCGDNAPLEWRVGGAPPLRQHGDSQTVICKLEYRKGRGLRNVRLLRPQSLTTHGDRGIRRRVSLEYLGYLQCTSNTPPHLTGLKILLSGKRREQRERHKGN